MGGRLRFLRRSLQWPTTAVCGLNTRRLRQRRPCCAELASRGGQRGLRGQRGGVCVRCGSDSVHALSSSHCARTIPLTFLQTSASAATGFDNARRGCNSRGYTVCSDCGCRSGGLLEWYVLRVHSVLGFALVRCSPKAPFRVCTCTHDASWRVIEGGGGHRRPSSVYSHPCV